MVDEGLGTCEELMWRRGRKYIQPGVLEVAKGSCFWRCMEMEYGRIARCRWGSLYINRGILIWAEGAQLVGIGKSIPCSLQEKGICLWGTRVWTRRRS